MAAHELAAENAQPPKHFEVAVFLRDHAGRLEEQYSWLLRLVGQDREWAEEQIRSGRIAGIMDRAAVTRRRLVDEIEADRKDIDRLLTSLKRFSTQARELAEKLAPSPEGVAREALLEKARSWLLAQDPRPRRIVPKLRRQFNLTVADAFAVVGAVAKLRPEQVVKRTAEAGEMRDGSGTNAGQAEPTR